MPLTINVGLSRKRSENYQSDGVSLNLTAELDQSLLAKPDELQQQIDALYEQAEQAIDRQVSPPSSRPDSSRFAHSHDTLRAEPRGNGNGRRPANVPARRNGNVAPMTASQRRAILVIAERLGIDARQEAVDVVGSELDRLDIRQASELIDHLKSQEPATNGGAR